MPGCGIPQSHRMLPFIMAALLALGCHGAWEACGKSVQFHFQAGCEAVELRNFLFVAC